MKSAFSWHASFCWALYHIIYSFLALFFCVRLRLIFAHLILMAAKSCHDQRIANRCHLQTKSLVKYTSVWVIIVDLFSLIFETLLCPSTSLSLSSSLSTCAVSIWWYCKADLMISFAVRTSLLVCLAWVCIAFYDKWKVQKILIIKNAIRRMNFVRR